jgi:ribosome-associated protein
MGRKTNSDEIIDDGLPQEDEGPSKSARKRAATEAQKLGERLVGLRESELAKLALPERLMDAIRAARTIRSNGGLARQRQYIGKLMREVDPEPILALLDAGSREQSLDAERFRRVEAWRDRLVAEGDPALTALGEWRSLSPEQHAKLADALRRARHIASTTEQRAAASRALFRALRELFAATPHDNISR